MILDGDIGSSSWNDSDDLDKYTAYTYGTTIYYPLITNSNDSKRMNTDYNSSFCYSDSFTLDTSTNKYKLSGNIFCEKMNDAEFYTKFNNMYTLYSTSKSTTSSKMYKIVSRYDESKHYHIEYDTESYSSSNSKFEYNLCYGSSYSIVNGKYKLAGTVNCGVEVTSSNYDTYKNRYTLLSTVENTTSNTMYKLIESKGSSRFYYRTYNQAVPVYYDSSSNVSNVKQLLDNWYRTNLYKYDEFISISTFCNDTSKTGTYYYANNRLAKTNPNPTFKCRGPFVYGGEYNLKIGLITADEMVFAGALYGMSNSNYYLAYEKQFWTMTSSLLVNKNQYIKSSMFASIIKTNTKNNSFDDGTDYVNDSYIAENYNVLGSIKVSYSSSSFSVVQNHLKDPSVVVRPVINLNSNVLMFDGGTGTYGNPYVIDTKMDDYYYVWYIRGDY